MFLNGLLVGPGYIVFIGAHLSWVYLRLYCLPKLTYAYYSLDFKEPVAHLDPFRIFVTILLSTLIAMHCFWYYLLVKVTINSLVTGKIKDTQNDLQKK